MNSSSTWLAGAALAAAALAAPGLASAQSTWNLISGGGCTQASTLANTYGNSWNCGAVTGGTAGSTVSASAYSTQNGSGTTNPIQNVTSGQYASAYMSSQSTSGFGVANRTEGLAITDPQHGADNLPTGQFDMFVLNFNTAVVLDQVGVGWTNSTTGADLMVWRWTGTGSPVGTATIGTSTTTNPALTKSGWQLVSALSDVMGDNAAPYGDTARKTYATLSSSWWMVSAFNSTLNTSNTCYTNNTGGTTAETASSTTASVQATNRCDDGDDSFKLNWLKTTVAGGTPTGGAAPEPGTLALVALALAGLGVARRREAAASRR